MDFGFTEEQRLLRDTARILFLRFRLGFAPESREALKRALAGKIPEALLVEGGYGLETAANA